MSGVREARALGIFRRCDTWDVGGTHQPGDLTPGPPLTDGTDDKSWPPKKTRRQPQNPQLRAATGQRLRISLGKPHRLHLPRLAPDPSSVVGQVYMTESRPCISSAAILSITSISPHPSPHNRHNGSRTSRLHPQAPVAWQPAQHHVSRLPLVPHPACDDGAARSMLTPSPTAPRKMPTTSSSRSPSARPWPRRARAASATRASSTSPTPS